MRALAIIGVCLLACGDDASTVPGDARGDSAGSDDAAMPIVGCAPLPAPTGNVISVTPAQAAQLPSIVQGAQTGTTISFADGTYTLPATLQMRTAGVTLRSASNDATKVILDGAYAINEGIAVSASNVTIAHVTVQRAIDHPIHVVSVDGGPDNVGFVLYGAHLIDGGEQFLKVNPSAARNAFIDNGRVECSVFRMTDAGRPMVERNPGGCYTGGIDTHSTRNWIVRQNLFEDIYCAGEGLAEHAIHFWVGGRDTLVENNTILNCARGIGFGLGQSGNGFGRVYADDPYPNMGYIGHYDGIIRNNVVWADIAYFDTGIGLEQARGVRVYHNTVVSAATATGFFSSIDYRFTNSVVDIRNNLTRRITLRDGASGTETANAQMVPLTSFVDAAGGDFHLAAGAAAIDQGVVVTGAGVDIDGETHDRGAPDLGADER